MKFVQIDDLTDDSQLSMLRFNDGRYRYVIVALGDHDTNFLVGAEIKTKILEFTTEPAPSFLINMYDESASRERLEGTLGVSMP